jgi:7-carboxy-7-deazaguanine synthase
VSSSAEAAASLRITEIFLSLQGESSTVGLPTVFVRLTGCPLRCVYCDSAYAFSGGTQIDIDAIVAQVSEIGVKHVTVTGGEPLAQPGVHRLMTKLCDLGSAVSLETSGALDVADVDTRVMKVVDLKTPGSQESHRNLWSNMAALTSRDQVKFVLCDRQDYAWAKLKCDEYNLYDRVGEVLFSPSFGQLNPTDLANWIVQDKKPVRMQVQLHKLLWGDEPGR